MTDNLCDPPASPCETLRAGRPKKVVYLLIIGFILFAVGVSFGSRSSTTREQPSSFQQTPTIPISPSPEEENVSIRQKANVIRVIDGDTIEVSLGPSTDSTSSLQAGSKQAGLKVRYIGIDTPETVDPRKPVQCFGREASLRNKELVEGKEVELEKDVSETDKFGRLLRYVYVNGLFVNEFMVREGFAHSSTFPPDVKYQEVLRLAQDEAREQNRGLWGKCKGEVQDSATVAPTIGVQTQKEGCVIKGNISSGGKIYHLPSCGSYDKTVINESQGERWFCSEEEAEASGWRKAKNC